jgi:hypothetical protein
LQALRLYIHNPDPGAAPVNPATIVMALQRILQ